MFLWFLVVIRFEWESNELLVYLRAVGGESASPATLAPKVGPLGMV